MWARSVAHTFLLPFLLLLLSLLLQSHQALAAGHGPPSSCLAGLQLQLQVPPAGAAWDKGGLELLQGVSLEHGKAASGGFGGRNGRPGVGGGGGGGQGQGGIKKSEEGGGILRRGHLPPVCMEQAPAAYYGQLMLFFCATISSMLVFVYYTAPAQLRTQISRQQPPRSRKAGRAGAGASLIVWRSKHGSLQAQVQVVNGGAGDGKWVPWVLLSRLFASSPRFSVSSSSSTSCSAVGSSEAQAPGSKTAAQERPRPGSGSGRKGSWKGAGRGSDRQGRQASRSSSEPGGGGSPTPASSTGGRQAGSGGGSVKQPKESFRKGRQSKRGFLGRSGAQEQLLVDAGDAHKDQQRKPAQSRSLRVESSLEVGTTPSYQEHKQQGGSSTRTVTSTSTSRSSSSRASKSDTSSPSSESPKSSSSSSGGGWAEWEGWGQATVQGGATGWWNRSGIWGPQDLNSTSSATAAFGRAVAFGSQGGWTPPAAAAAQCGPEPFWGDGHCSWLLRPDSLVTSFVDSGSLGKELDCEAAAGPGDFPKSLLIQDIDKRLLKCRARPYSSSVEGDTDWSSSLPSSPGCFSPFSSPRASAVGSRRVVGVIGQGLNGSNGGNPCAWECAEQVPVPIQYCPLLAPSSLADCPLLLPIPKVSCSLWSDDSLFAP